MNSPLKKDNFPYRWFRWLPFTVLFSGALMPASFMIYAFIVDPGKQTYFDDSQIYISLLLMIVPFLFLFFPISGGILGLFVIPVVIYGYELVYSFSGGLSKEGEQFLHIITTILIIGSLLSIIYGIVRWWWQRKQQKNQAAA